MDIKKFVRDLDDGKGITFFYLRLSICHGDWKRNSVLFTAILIKLENTVHCTRPQSLSVLYSK